jgi:hypothetical protein
MVFGSTKTERIGMGNMLAVLGILVGLFLIRNGVDSFVEWRAWLLTISGLCFLILGIIRIYLQLRDWWANETES